MIEERRCRDRARGARDEDLEPDLAILLAAFRDMIHAVPPLPRDRDALRERSAPSVEVDPFRAFRPGASNPFQPSRNVAMRTVEA